MDEKIDILDASGRPTCVVRWKSEAHRLGLWHRCFHCWVAGTDGEGPYLLLQRRAAAKDTWPGRLDVTAAGHLAADEKPLDGLRELEEELGLRVEPGRLIPLGERRVEQRIPAGRDREFHEVFLLFDPTPPAGLRLQREEVASVLRVGLGAMESLRAGGPVPAEEYEDGNPRAVKISLADFVPAEDDYYPRVAASVRRILAGDRPGPVF